MQIEQAIPYLVKMADWAAGQGFCQIEGIQDPDEWIMEAWDALGEGKDYSPEALATRLSARLDDSAVERVAFAIIEGSAGLRAAEHAREFQTANWTDALRSARAAIAALGGSGSAVNLDR